MYDGLHIAGKLPKTRSSAAESCQVWPLFAVTTHQGQFAVYDLCIMATYSFSSTGLIYASSSPQTRPLACLKHCFLRQKSPGTQLGCAVLLVQQRGDLARPQTHPECMKTSPGSTAPTPATHGAAHQQTCVIQRGTLMHCRRAAIPGAGSEQHCNHHKRPSPGTTRGGSGAGSVSAST